MAEYQDRPAHDIIYRRSDGVRIPKDQQNPDYRAYLDWVALGNTVDPPDPPAIRIFEPNTITRTLTTPNAAATPMPAIPVPSDSISDAHIRVTAHNPATSATRMWWFWVAAQRSAGNAQLIGTPQQAPASQPVGTTPAAGAVVITVSGQNLIITCTGIASQTWKWLAEIDARIRRPTGF